MDRQSQRVRDVHAKEGDERETLCETRPNTCVRRLGTKRLCVHECLWQGVGDARLPMGRGIQQS